MYNICIIKLYLFLPNFLDSFALLRNRNYVGMNDNPGITDLPQFAFEHFLKEKYYYNYNDWIHFDFKGKF